MLSDIAIGLLVGVAVLFLAEHCTNLTAGLCKFWSKFVPSGEREDALEEWLSNGVYIDKPMTRLLHAFGIGASVVPKALSRSVAWSASRWRNRHTLTEADYGILLIAYFNDINRMLRFGAIPALVAWLVLCLCGANIWIALPIAAFLGTLIAAFGFINRGERPEIAIRIDEILSEQSKK